MAAPPAPAPSPGRTAALAGLAALVHLACDAALYPISWARPPYLRLEEMPEAFRELPMVSAPAAVAVASSAVGGILAAIALASVEPRAPRRRGLVVGLVTGFWLFSALLAWLTWLSTPFAQVLPGLLLGVPRGLLVGLLVERLSRPGVSAGPA